RVTVLSGGRSATVPMADSLQRLPDGFIESDQHPVAQLEDRALDAHRLHPAAEHDFVRAVFAQVVAAIVPTGFIKPLARFSAGVAAVDSVNFNHAPNHASSRCRRQVAAA